MSGWQISMKELHIFSEMDCSISNIDYTSPSSQAKLLLYIDELLQLPSFTMHLGWIKMILKHLQYVKEGFHK